MLLVRWMSFFYRRGETTACRNSNRQLRHQELAMISAKDTIFT